MIKPKIISGKLRGQTLNVAAATRPLTDRIKHSLFDLLGELLLEKEILDGYAGSGSFGFEALSRGAKGVTFVEIDEQAQKFLHQNIQKFGVGEQARVINRKLQEYLAHTDAKFDLIFLDPPFRFAKYLKVDKLVEKLNPEGILVLRLPTDSIISVDESKWILLHEQKYGDSIVFFYTPTIAEEQRS